MFKFDVARQDHIIRMMLIRKKMRNRMSQEGSKLVFWENAIYSDKFQVQSG